MKSPGAHPDPEQLGAYHDRELEPGQARAIEAHLEGCTECRNALDEIGQVDAFGPALREDMPPDAFWPGLAGRIEARLKSGDDAGESEIVDLRSVGNIPATAGRKTKAPVRVPVAAGRPGWWARTFGPAPTLRWGLATAAGLIVLVLASRVIVSRLAPDEMVRSSRSDAVISQEQVTPPAGDEASTSPTGGQAGGPDQTSRAETPAETPPAAKEGAAPGPSDHFAVLQKNAGPPPAGVTAKRPTRVAQSSESSPGPGAPAPASARQSATSLSATEPQSVSSDKALRPTDHVVAQTAPPATGSQPPAQGAATTTRQVPATSSAEGATGDAAPAEDTRMRSPATAGELRSMVSAPTSDATGREVSPGASNEALAYAALVDRELRPAAGTGSGAVVEPQTLGEKVEQAGRTLWTPSRVKPRLEDYRIAFAAALRALDAGRPDLARKGFSLVARGIPETDLARDAEYNERLAQVRVLQQQGEDQEIVLRDAQERADQAWDLAQTRKLPATCRSALAYERVRITLLQEIRPGTDLKSFDERIRILRECS